MKFEALPAYALATVLQLPFHLFFALPWLAVAWTAWRFSRRLTLYPRAALVSIPLAAGLAPFYGAHAGMLPAYLVVLGEHAQWPGAFLSFAITLPLTFGFTTWLIKPKTNERSAQSNS